MCRIGMDIVTGPMHLICLRNFFLILKTNLMTEMKIIRFKHINFADIHEFCEDGVRYATDGPMLIVRSAFAWWLRALQNK